MQNDYYNYTHCYTDSKQPTMEFYSEDQGKGGEASRKKGEGGCHSTPYLSKPFYWGPTPIPTLLYDSANLSFSEKEEQIMLSGNTLVLELYILWGLCHEQKFVLVTDFIHPTINKSFHLPCNINIQHPKCTSPISTAQHL